MPELVGAEGFAVDALMDDADIIRSRAKIESTIGNARAYLDMAARCEDFDAFIWSHVNGGAKMGGGQSVSTSDATSLVLFKALKAHGFKVVASPRSLPSYRSSAWSMITRPTAPRCSACGDL